MCAVQLFTTSLTSVMRALSSSFDVLFRLLRHIYGEKQVIYVRNVTDVDDKINARAAERGIAIGQLTKETYEDFP